MAFTVPTSTADHMKRATPPKAVKPSNRPPWMEEPSRPMKVAKAALLILITIAMVFPFIYVVAVSFSSYKDVLGGGLILFPANPTLDAYREVLKGGIVTRSVIVTIWLTVIGSFVQVVFTATMAYGLSRPRMPGARLVLIIVLFTFLFGPGMIPLFLLVKELGLLNTYAALVVPGLISAFNLIVVRSFFMNIPQELLDSARVDGANDLRVFWDITLPLSKAVLAVITLFYGVALWNTFFNAVLYMNESSKWPIQVILNQYVLQGALLPIEQSPDQPPPPPKTVQMAVVVIATVPILIVYPFLQRYFTRGVLTGAIKG